MTPLATYFFCHIWRVVFGTIGTVMEDKARLGLVAVSVRPVIIRTSISQWSLIKRCSIISI